MIFNIYKCIYFNFYRTFSLKYCYIKYKFLLVDRKTKPRFLGGVLPIRFYALLRIFGSKTIHAVNWSSLSRLEGYLSCRTTLSASSVVHLSIFSTLLFIGSSACRTSAGLVLKTFISVKLLL